MPRFSERVCAHPLRNLRRSPPLCTLRRCPRPSRARRYTIAALCAYAAFGPEFAMKIAYAADVLGPHFPALPGVQYFWGVSIALRSTFIRDLKIHGKWDHQTSSDHPHLKGTKSWRRAASLIQPLVASRARTRCAACTNPSNAHAGACCTHPRQATPATHCGRQPPIAGASHPLRAPATCPPDVSVSPSARCTLHASRCPPPATRRSLVAGPFPLPLAARAASQFSTLPATYTHAKTFRPSTYEHSLPHRSSATAVRSRIRSSLSRGGWDVGMTFFGPCAGVGAGSAFIGRHARGLALAPFSLVGGVDGAENSASVSATTSSTQQSICERTE
ncbi:hypothetical protein GGX14DRAFT_647438 [Mycena pura]|uniref:Uncharacterized protein n=1 Tax=Mycena pura TaxID=153505 RepID=A0AAD6V6R6_9AGAR|nr:hypothetical protein GGX14DRAFT_647438 [Mycena pura]